MTTPPLSTALPTISFGGFTVAAPTLGMFRLDGGAMFGAVPKNLWAQRITADAENCIPLAVRSLLVRTRDRLFLVDVGMGEKWSPKQRDIFAIRNTPPAEWGFNPADVTDVVLTHLHFDHAGGISHWQSDANSPAVLTYPRAQIHLQADNLTAALKPSLKERASYLAENVLPVQAHPTLQLHRGSTEIAPGFWIHQVNGHTHGQQIIELRSDTERLYFLTDLTPTSRHLPVAFHMGYDMCAELVLREKEEILSRIVAENAIVVFQHDPDTPAGRVTRDSRGQFTLGERIAL